MANLTTFVGDYQPDALYHVGDLIDMPTVSRWAKGTALEYERTLQSDADETVKVLTEIRRVYDGPFGYKRGNHDMRVESYAHKYAPGLTDLRALQVEELLRLDTLQIDYLRGITDIGPGWVIAHGDEGTLNRAAGATAASLAKRTGKSVVCGHTHKLALRPAEGPEGYNGKQAPTVWGMEVGHAMDISKAAYLKTGSALWQQGLGLLYVKGSVAIPSIVPINKGTFIVEGQVYG